MKRAIKISFSLQDIYKRVSYNTFETLNNNYMKRT